jgi:transcriptional regulator GlxA family with amidase domain
MAEFPRSTGFTVRSHLSRLEIVELIVQFMSAHAGEPVQMAQLCDATGVSERSVRNACHAVCGMSPKRFLMRQRMEAVRQALVSAGPGRSTVTRIATDHGFFELGRFAATYTALFGERPSETLRSSAMASKKPAA